MDLNTKTDKHLCSSMSKGQVYFTKDRILLDDGKYYAIKYLFLEYDQLNKCSGKKMLDLDAAIRSLIYLGTGEVLNQFLKTSNGYYPMFIYNNVICVMYSVKFYESTGEKKNIYWPQYTFDCCLNATQSEKEPFYPVKLEILFDK